MVALLKKDFLTSRYIYSIITLIVVCVSVLIVRIQPSVSMMIGVLGSVIIPSMVNKFTATEEMRKNYDIVMNSFPIKRKDVVVSKYLYYAILYFLTAIILQSIVIINSFGDSEVLLIILIGQGLGFLFYILMIGLPNFIYYSFDYEVAAKYSTIITIGIVYMPIILIELINKINPNIRIGLMEYISRSDQRGFILAGLVFLVGFILYAIIIIASYKGYKRRDL